MQFDSSHDITQLLGPTTIIAYLRTRRAFITLFENVDVRWLHYSLYEVHPYQSSRRSDGKSIQIYSNRFVKSSRIEWILIVESKL